MPQGAPVGGLERVGGGGGGVCGDVLEPAGSKPPSKKHINSLNPDSPKKTTVSEQGSETVCIYFLHDNLFLDFFV